MCLVIFRLLIGSNKNLCSNCLWIQNRTLLNKPCEWNARDLQPDNLQVDEQCGEAVLWTVTMQWTKPAYGQRKHQKTIRSYTVQVDVYLKGVNDERDLQRVAPTEHIIIITLFKSQIILAEHECSTNWGDCKSNKSNQIKCWLLRRGENRSTHPEKNLSEQSREPTNSAHI